MQRYVVDLETAKKLKEYLPEGFESEFMWVFRQSLGFRLEPTLQIFNEREEHLNKMILATDVFYIEEKDLETFRKISNRKLIVYPAPILEEMLELLPHAIHHIDDTDKLTSFFEMTKTYIGYRCAGKATKVEFYGRKQNIATAAALLYIWLVDNGYVDKPTP